MLRSFAPVICSGNLLRSAGKLISPEQYVLKRAEAYIASVAEVPAGGDGAVEGARALMLPGFEHMYFFHGYAQVGCRTELCMCDVCVVGQ